MSKEHSYAYEAGYRDGAINYELDHCPACKNVADLQEVLDENAKLRELVKDMWPHVRHRSRMCAECELPCDTSDECLLYEPMQQRMHELGIEVGEDVR